MASSSGEAGVGEPSEPAAQRSSEQVPVFTETGLSACSQLWQLQPGQQTLVVVVKASARLLPEGPAELCETEPPQGDVYFGDQFSGSCLYPSDFAVFKRKGDVVLRGHACAPGGKARIMQVRFRFGTGHEGFDRRVAVYGPRRWAKGKLGKLAATIGEPEPFERVPLVWERAFGGEGIETNPLGLGVEGEALPQLEAPEQLIVAQRDRPPPVALCAVPKMFPARWSKLGTYGDKWLGERFPYFAEDLDPAFFQAAPPEQQLAQIQPGASYRIEGVHPEHAVIEGALPALRPRIFAQRTQAAGGAFDEVALSLDTVVFDTDAMRVDLVWRGRTPVADERALDVRELYLFCEEPEQTPLKGMQVRARYQAERWPTPEGEAESDGAAGPGGASESGGASGPGGLAEPAEDEHVARVKARLTAAGIAPDGSDAAVAVGGAAVVGAVAAGAAAVGAVAAATPADPDAQEGRRRAEALLAEAEPLDGAILQDADLSGLDMSGRSLRASYLQRSSLRGCNLAGADLTGAALAGADLSEADLSGARLDLADLRGAKLDGATLSGASLDYTEMAEVSGRGARLDGARGKLPSFIEGHWHEASFVKAELKGPAFSASDISRARFDGAVLEEIRLYETRGEEVSFQDAELPGARADGAQLRDCSFQGVQADESVWDKASLAGCRFVGASLVRAGLREVKADGAHFDGADLRGARLVYAALAGATLCRANLMAADLQSADLSGADLRGANLHAAETWQAKLDEANLQGAIVTGSKLADKAS